MAIHLYRIDDRLIHGQVVVGWGQPVRSNGWAPDGRWFGDTPRVIADVRSAEAAALIPKVQAAIAAYKERKTVAGIYVVRCDATGFGQPRDLFFEIRDL